MLFGRFSTIGIGNFLFAIGCTLSNPAEDLKSLFPNMTTYKEELKEFSGLPNGRKQFKALRERLGSDLDPIYETYEIPYTIYKAFQGQKQIGLVHGVNVPGKGGVIQVFLSVDPVSAQIKKFFFQRLESPAAKQLRDKEFRKQFEGMSLGDFHKKKIKPPSKLPIEGQQDYDASLRGIRKNLLLLDFFVFRGKP